jgi:hypothetical protein
MAKCKESTASGAIRALQPTPPGGAADRNPTGRGHTLGLPDPAIEIHSFQRPPME